MRCPLLVWADNVWLLASSEADLHDRVADILAVFEAARLVFSDESLELLATPACGLAPGPWSSCNRVFARPEGMSALGVALSATADTEVMIKHRVRAAESSWARHRAALTDGAVPASVRWRRWHDTVGASLLWGAALWRPSSTLQRRLHTIEASHLRRVLGMRKRDGETWIEFYRRRRGSERRVRALSNRPTLFHTTLTRIHQWLGHAARSPLSFLSAALRCRDTAHWRTRQQVAADAGLRASGGWRHPTRNWQRDTDFFLSECLGADWKDRARDRAAWQDSLPAWMAWATSACGALSDPNARDRPPLDEAAAAGPRRVRRRSAV